MWKRVTWATLAAALAVLAEELGREISRRYRSK